MRFIKDNLPIILVFAVTALAFLGVLLMADKAEQSATASKDIPLEKLLENDPYKKGSNREAKVVLVEFSDFQCPGCAAAYPIINSLLEKHDGKLLLAYRHFPLPIHFYAKKAAQAAEAAGKQNKFFEYGEKLFENQDNLKDEDLIKYATDLGLDVEQFKTDMESQPIIDKVNRDVTYTKELNLTGTPSFYLNGKYIDFQSFSDLTKAVDEEVAKVYQGQ